MTVIACLHAARSNIALYEDALRGLDFSDVELLHRVEGELLASVADAGDVTEAIADATRQAIHELCDYADAVIVTCTTLGVVAWDASQFSKPVIRVDAALAKVASRYQGSILVLCTAHATLAATTHLFEAFIPPERLSVELIPGAWVWFNAGDFDGYYREIAGYIQQRPESPLGCIVLAQISMAGAEKQINSTLSVLTGPAVSLQAAIDALY
ncbi:MULTISPECIES: hypothetical protein [Erwinia]|uniref:hypothetical protein n=1 Tax=Erwinia TaxID=551 RepID=UPI00054ECC59|nr:MULTISPECIES: hypothetical protein [Erwinia]